MVLNMAAIKMNDSLENKRKVTPMDITNLGEESGPYVTVAVMDLIQVAVLLLRNLVINQELNASSITIEGLLKNIPAEFRAEPWYNYFKVNTSRINKWLKQYQDGMAIRMLPGQYGIFYDNVKWLYESVEKAHSMRN